MITRDQNKDLYKKLYFLVQNITFHCHKSLLVNTGKYGRIRFYECDFGIVARKQSANCKYKAESRKIKDCQFYYELYYNLLYITIFQIQPYMNRFIKRLGLDSLELEKLGPEESRTLMEAEKTRRLNSNINFIG